MHHTQTAKRVTTNVCLPLSPISRLPFLCSLLREATEGLDEGIYSAAFYTENFGYKLTTLFYPNGLKAEKNNSYPFTLLQQGVKKRHLTSFTFQKKVKFKLTDQRKIKTKGKMLLLRSYQKKLHIAIEGLKTKRTLDMGVLKLYLT